MILVLAAHLAVVSLHQEGNLARAYILGGGSEPLPNRQKMAELVLKYAKGPGWKDLPDGKVLYTSPKQVSYLYQPSLREVRNWQTIVFFRKKIEQGGFWAKFKFEELPEFIKDQMRSTLPDLDFRPESMVSVGPKVITKIVGAGRKIEIPNDLLRPSTQGNTNPTRPSSIADMDPVNEKQNKSLRLESPWLPFYQVWNLNVGFDGQRSEKVQEMLTLLSIEMDQRTDFQLKALFALLKDNKQFSDYLGLVGRNVEPASTNAADDKASKVLLNSLNVFRDVLGLHENDDWDNFTKQASVNSISLGFSVNVVIMVKGRRQLVGIGP